MRYLTMNGRRKMLGDRGPTTFYRDIEAGRLPAPTKISGINDFSDNLVFAALQELSPKPESEV